MAGAPDTLENHSKRLLGGDNGRPIRRFRTTGRPSKPIGRRKGRDRSATRWTGDTSARGSRSSVNTGVWEDTGGPQTRRIEKPRIDGGPNVGKQKGRLRGHGQAADPETVSGNVFVLLASVRASSVHLHTLSHNNRRRRPFPIPPLLWAPTKCRPKS